MSGSEWRSKYSDEQLKEMAATIKKLQLQLIGLLQRMVEFLRGKVALRGA
jgi:hypothetical protein